MNGILSQKFVDDNIMNKIVKGPSPRLKVLSLAKQARLRSYWDQKLQDPRVFAPTAKLQELSLTEIRNGNELLGRFASSYLRFVMRRISGDGDVARRLVGEKKILAVGYGRGYDFKGWLEKAIEFGLRTWCIDVSFDAWMQASTEFSNQFNNIENVNPNMKPEVKTFEIQSLLADPSKAELDMSSVEVCYLCRLLNCLPTSSAKIVLQEIGRTMFSSISDSAARNAVVILNALSDDNDACKCGGISIIRSKKMILSNIGLGAGHPVQARFIRHHDFFGKKVTAMTIMSKL